MINPRKPLTQTAKIGKPKILRPSFSPTATSSQLRHSNSSTSSLLGKSKVKNASSESIATVPNSNSNNSLKISVKVKSKLDNLSFPVLPMIITAKPQEVKSLFIQKCAQCYQMCDFSRSPTNSFIVAKDDVLKEILSVLKENYPKIQIDEEINNSIFTLIAIHIMRNPQKIPSEWFSIFDYYMLTDQEGLEWLHPLEWLHISIVYDIAIAYISLPQFDPNHYLSLCGDLIKLSIFESRTSDDREQEKLKLLIFTLYKKVKKLRSFTLNVLSFALTRIIFENEPFTSAKPLLSVLSSIVAGFQKPLKSKYIMIYQKVIIPLHRNSYLAYFSRELFCCVIQFLEHDHKLAIELYRTIIRDWPRLQPEKQLLFIDEITILSSFVDESFLKEAIRLICPQLMTSLMSCHAAIAEKILSMWEINDFVWMMTVEPAVSYPLLIPSIFEVGKIYWNPEIRLIASSVLNIMRLNNQKMFDATGENLKKLKSVSIMNGLTRAAKWKYLIMNYENDLNEKKKKLFYLSQLFDGLESINPFVNDIEKEE